MVHMFLSCSMLETGETNLKNAQVGGCFPYNLIALYDVQESVTWRLVKHRATCFQAVAHYSSNERVFVQVTHRASKYSVGGFPLLHNKSNARNVEEFGLLLWLHVTKPR